MTFIIRRFTRIEGTGENKMIPIFGDFSIKFYDFAPIISP
jgi:hypothetical protein